MLEMFFHPDEETVRWKLVGVLNQFKQLKQKGKE